MSTEHPITPSLEQVEQWNDDWITAKVKHVEFGVYLATQAARWGADQELEACCEWISLWCPKWPDGTQPEGRLRATRRPKPPSLKEQSIALLDKIQSNKQMWQLDELDIIRRALEALPE